MEFISVPTITLCMFIAMMAISVAMAAIWHNDRKEIAAGLWSLSFLVGASSAMTVALLSAGSATGIMIALCLNATSFALSWSAYRTFGKRRVYPALVACVPAAVLFIHLMFPAIRENPNYSIMFHSSVVCCMSFANAGALQTGEGNSELSLTRYLVGFLVLHGLFHGVNIFVTYHDPSQVVGGRLTSIWFKLFMLESFLNVIVIATSSLMLIKERSEQRHRVASETDMLTGVANRRAFVQRTEQALKDASENAVLGVIDLDHFKAINDQFGHQAGDRALVEFARTVKSRLPSDVLFGRIGGEEFAVFIPENPARDALALLDDLRHSVEVATIQSNGRPLLLTVSIGGTTIAKAGLNFDNLVAAADCALYAAKEDGRNRVVMFSPTMRLLKVLEHDGEKRVGLAEQRVSRRMTRTHASITTQS